MRIPVVDIDPRDTGPEELIVAKYRSLRSWISQPIISVALIASTVVVIGLVWHFSISIPEMPGWGWVALLSAVLALPSGWYVGKRMTAEVYEPDTILMSRLNVYNGDLELRKLTPEDYADLTVLNHRGDQVEREHLRDVVINGRKAIEVDTYDPVSNTATASWQAGVADAQIRHDHSTIQLIKTELDYEIDKVYDLLSQSTQNTREQLSDFASQIVMVAQDVELPDGTIGGLHEQMHDDIEDNDPARDLMDKRFEEGDRPNVEIEIEGANNGD